MGLVERIQEAARRAPGLRFDRFMEMALYDPEEGYYSVQPAPAGRDGDFLTAPETSPIFAACVAEYRARSAGPRAGELYHLVEAGPGRGTLARQLLEALRTTPLGERLVVHLLERGRSSREALARSFKAEIDEGTVTVASDVEHLPRRMHGGILANELFDNFPVRRVMQTDRLMEILLRWRRGRFEEDLAPASAELQAYFQSPGVALRSGQAAEVAPGAAGFLERLVDRFAACNVLLIDYGDEAARLYDPDAFPNGTLAAHRRHGTDRAFTEDIGKKDLTAHVNFTPLMGALARRGFSVDPLTTQAQFLLDHGFAERVAALPSAAETGLEPLQSRLRARTIFHPEAMGEAFRVLRASRGPHGVSGHDRVRP